MTLTSKQLAEQIVQAVMESAFESSIGFAWERTPELASAVLRVLHDQHCWFMHAPERMDDPSFGQPVLPLFDAPADAP